MPQATARPVLPFMHDHSTVERYLMKDSLIILAFEFRQVSIQLPCSSLLPPPPATCYSLSSMHFPLSSQQLSERELGSQLFTSSFTSDQSVLVIPAKTLPLGNELT